MRLDVMHLGAWLPPQKNKIMERLDDQFKKVKVQKLIDRILYLEEKEFNKFMRSFNSLCDEFKPTAKMKWTYEDVQDIPE